LESALKALGVQKSDPRKKSPRSRKTSVVTFGKLLGLSGQQVFRLFFSKAKTFQLTLYNAARAYEDLADYAKDGDATAELNALEVQYKKVVLECYPDARFQLAPESPNMAQFDARYANGHALAFAVAERLLEHAEIKKTKFQTVVTHLLRAFLDAEIDLSITLKQLKIISGKSPPDRLRIKKAR